MSFKDWWKNIMRRIGGIYRDVTIDQNGDPVPPPPAKEPSEGHYVCMNYTPSNKDDNVPSVWFRDHGTLAGLPSPDDLTAKFTESPNLKGAFTWHYWREIEPTLGNYVWDGIDADIAACAAAGKRLIVGIADRTFTNNHNEPLPDYMRAYSFPSVSKLTVGGSGTPQDGWGKTGLRWHPYYVTRFSALVNAIQTRYNGNAAFEGISIEESAHGFEPSAADPPWQRTPANSLGADEWYPYCGPSAVGPCGDSAGANAPLLPWGAGDAVQYSATRYCNFYKDMLIATKATRTTSRFFVSINYIQGGQDKNGAMVQMFQQLAAQEALHAVIGGPDWFPSFSHWKGKQAGPSYSLGTNSQGICGVVLPRYKQALDLGLKIYTFFQFIEYDTGPNGAGNDGPGSKNSADDFTPATPPREYTMAQMFTHATTLLGENGITPEQPGSGNPYGIRPAYLFWNNTESGRVFNYTAHAVPVIAANPTWTGSGGTSW